MEIIVEAANILDEAVVLEERQYKQKVSTFKRIARVLTGLFKDLKKLVVVAIKKRNFGAVKAQWRQLCENAKRNIRKYDTHSEWVEKVVSLEKQDNENGAKSTLEEIAEQFEKEVKKTEAEIQKRLDNIRNRHAEAAKTIKDSLRNIYRNDVEVMNDRTPKAERTETDETLDRISKDLDELLSDL